MAMCEDFPCCGHTDGLGCDWVSPNEISPLNVPADFECEDCGRSDSKHPAYDSLCYNCGVDADYEWERECWFSGANE